jgi:hypothetical protein
VRLWKKLLAAFALWTAVQVYRILDQGDVWWWIWPKWV